jgi:hypothetical protein
MSVTERPADEPHAAGVAADPPDAGHSDVKGPPHAARRRAHITVGALAAFVTGAVGFAATANGVVFDIFPGLRPDPGVELAVEMQVVGVDRGVTFPDYWKRIREKGAPDKRLAGDVGDVAYVRVRIRGRKNQTVSLARSIYELPSRKRLGDHSTQRDHYFRASTTNDQWIAQIWLPPMLHSQRYFARLELWEGNDLLAFADTRPLRGSVRRLF